MKTSHLKTLRTIAGMAALAVAGLVSACADAGNGPPTDVGSMALPNSAQGAAAITSSTTGPARFDTGNMAYPEPQPQGVISRTASQARYPDTGNMAYPSPRPQGDFVRTPQ